MNFQVSSLSWEVENVSGPAPWPLLWVLEVFTFKLNYHQVLLMASFSSFICDTVVINHCHSGLRGRLEFGPILRVKWPCVWGGVGFSMTFQDYLDNHLLRIMTHPNRKSHFANNSPKLLSEYSKLSSVIGSIF